MSEQENTPIQPDYTQPQMPQQPEMPPQPEMPQQPEMPPQPEMPQQPQIPPQPQMPQQPQAFPQYDSSYPQAQPDQPSYEAVPVQQPYMPQADAGGWQQPAADPYAQPAADPYAQPVANPYAQQPDGQYTQPASPYVQPGMAPGTYTAPAPQKNGKATGALICGIAAILTSPTIFLGIILGIVALVLARSAKKQSPDGKATGGLVCGAIGLALSVIMIIAAVIFGVAVYDVVKNDPDFQSTISQTADPEDAFIGTWNYESATAFNDSMTDDDIEAIASLGLTLTFNEDGTCSLNAPSDSLEGTWEVSSDNVADISFGGSPATATISGDRLTLTEQDDEIVFTRGSAPVAGGGSSSASGSVLIDDGLCTIEVTDVYIDSAGDLRIDIAATNNSSGSIEIYGDIGSWQVNGTSVDGYCYTPLEPGESIDDFFYMEGDKLPSSNIDELNSLTGTLIVEDADGNRTTYPVNLSI